MRAEELQSGRSHCDDLKLPGLLVESGTPVEYPYAGSGEWIYKTMQPI